MKITTHQVRTMKDLPDVFQVFDEMDTRYIAGFENYPAPAYTLIVAHGRTWPQGVAVLVGPIITAFVISYDVSNRRSAQVLTALIAHLQATYPWLVVHDADYAEIWTEHGFHVIEPPANVPAEDAVLVLAWGEQLKDVHALMRALRLSWIRNVHRGFVREAT